MLLETRQLQAHSDAVISSYPGGRATALEAAGGDDPGLSAQLLVHHLAAARNKRCLLAYHAHRLAWLRERLWAAGGSAPQVLAEDEETEQGALRARLSPAEIKALKGYAELLRGFKAVFADVVDITAPLHRGGIHDVAPPAELMVCVVARRDARDVLTARGSLNLRRGERMRVARAEVEHLIVRGWLAVVDE